MSETLESIETLEAEVKRLGAALDDARSRLQAAREASAEFKVGDVVEVRRWGWGSPWLEAQVTSVRFYGGPYRTGPEYHVRKRNKDGSWSKVIWRYVSEVRKPE